VLLAVVIVVTVTLALALAVAGTLYRIALRDAFEDK
jgi:hypothetical protein